MLWSFWWILLLFFSRYFFCAFILMARCFYPDVFFFLTISFFLLWLMIRIFISYICNSFYAFTFVVCVFLSHNHTLVIFSIYFFFNVVLEFCFMVFRISVSWCFWSFMRCVSSLFFIFLCSNRILLHNVSRLSKLVNQKLHETHFFVHFL